MKQAIITGATGFIGSHLSNFLAYHGIKVYALGRKKINEVPNTTFIKSDLIHYVNVSMQDISMLPNILINEMETLDDCVFFNFAWGGSNGLSDLDVEAQLNNALWTLDAYNVAANLKCSKFIHVGTMEEAFADKYLLKDFHGDNEYNRHLIYSIAKRTSRNLLKTIYHSGGPDLIIASNSHIMGPNDRRDSFLTTVMRHIVENKPLNLTSCIQNFDVVSVYDCVRAYKLIAEKGINKSEYWIGSGKPQQLKKYVTTMVNMYSPAIELNFGSMPYNDVILDLDTFSPCKLNNDTGFTCKQSYEDAVRDLYQFVANGIITSHYEL